MKIEKSAQLDAFEHQPKGEFVSIAPSVSARDMARQMIADDARTHGGVQPASRALAHRLGVSRYTLRSLSSGSLKRVCVDLYARLKAEQIRRLSQSLARATHELEVARAIGLDPRSAEFRALEAAAEAARKVMEEA